MPLSTVGEASVPWLAGWLSTRLSSLRTALIIPLAGCEVMLLIFVRPEWRRGSAWMVLKKSITPSAHWLLLASLALLLGGFPGASAQSTPDERVEIDAAAPLSPFPHFWEQMFGSGRAILTLRESYRHDLRAVKAVTDFQYVRFHAILHDEVGVYNEDEHGNPIYNFSYVNQIYDGLLQSGVRPVV